MMRSQLPWRAKTKFMNLIAKDTHPESLQKEFSPQRPFSLKISNQKSRYKLQFGNQFKTFLEARDQVLEHPFCFEYNLKDYDLLSSEQELINNGLYVEIKKNTKKFMVESVSNVVSAGFKYLLNQELEDNQSKQFTSKNIMLNIQAIYRETVASIRDHPLLKGKIDKEELRMDLILEIDNVLENILTNLADSYPQAPVAGGTPRMREVINEVNRVEDQENDFIFTCGLKICEYLEVSKEKKKPHLLEPRADENYTEFIMKVINMAIEVTHDNSQDFKQRTVFQKFTEFNQNLFWISQEKEYHSLLNTVEKNRHKPKNQQAQSICDVFNQILRNDEPSQVKKKRTAQSISEEGLDEGTIEYILQKSEEGISAMKKTKQFALGQKIPASVKPFKKQEISAQQFDAKHSSIMRILTKWAGYLQQIFENGEQMIKQRKYSFKNIFHQFIQISEEEPTGQDKLIFQLKEEYIEVKKKFNEIVLKSYDLIGQFLSGKPDESFVSNVSRFTQTRGVSSKINTVLTSLMLQYTNILIHHLLRAGKRIQTTQSIHGSWWHNINLIAFRVSDLMRSKLQCSQSSFTSLLKTMYLLENNDSMKGKFKLIRIKNKLDDPANNIMINYLFMGKVQCELQLSIQDVKGKEKNYYTFSHFVYELTRGKFGSLAECAIMISQLDPMITACRGSCYTQKNEPIRVQRKQKTLKTIQPQFVSEVSPTQPSQTVEQYQIQAFFECSTCKKLTTNERPRKLFSKGKICFECIIGRGNHNSFLRIQNKKIFDPIEHLLITSYKDSVNSLIASYKDIKDKDKEMYLIELTASGEIKLWVMTYLENEMKTFSIEINHKILEEVTSDGFGADFNFDNIGYISISKKIKRNDHKMLGYLLQEQEMIPDQVLKLAGVDKTLLTNVKHMIEEFSQFRSEKNIVKAIKLKTQVMKVKEVQGRVLDRVCQATSKKREGRPRVEIGAKLRYNKFRLLDLSNMRCISVSASGLRNIPNWIVDQCPNIQRLQLSNNQIEGKVTVQHLPVTLSLLNLSKNIISAIDISQLEKLTHLYLSENKLTQLDTRNNKKLTRMEAAKNNLVEYDIGEDSNLDFIFLEQNKLEKLNLRANQHLKRLTIQANRSLPKVTYLPPTIQRLRVDREVIIDYDFMATPKLSKLVIYHGKSILSDFKNLKEGIQYKYTDKLD